MQLSPDPQIFVLAKIPVMCTPVYSLAFSGTCDSWSKQRMENTWKNSLQASGKAWKE